jgi:hypothetical protein
LFGLEEFLEDASFVQDKRVETSMGVVGGDDGLVNVFLGGRNFIEGVLVHMLPDKNWKRYGVLKNIRAHPPYVVLICHRTSAF